MNYYIKGDHPVEWVRAKFRELGVSKEKLFTFYDFMTDKSFYCIVGGNYEPIFSEAVKATIEASPDWEEVKPAESKFKVGDIVMYCNGFFQVSEVRFEEYGVVYYIGFPILIEERKLTRPENPTVRHKVKEAFAILNNQQTINFD